MKTTQRERAPGSTRLLFAAAIATIAAGCSTSGPSNNATPRAAATAERSQQSDDAVAAISALNPLCDLAVLPRPDTALDDRKEIIEAEYGETVSNTTADDKTVTVTIDLWGRPAERSTEPTLTRRLVVRQSAFLSTREWTSYEFDLLPRGNDPYRLIIEGLDGENGCEVSLLQPESLGGQTVRWRSRNRADLNVVAATSRRDPRASDTQVKAAEGTAAGARRDVLRVRSNGEAIDVYILGPEP